MLTLVRLPIACLLWLYAMPVLALTLLADLAARLGNSKPLDRPIDAPPATRNAAILILNWNGRDFLEKLLPTVENAVALAQGEHEVIVIDNGSTDDSVELVERDFAWAKIVRVPENRFFIRGNRAGLPHVADDKDVLVFLNNDMEVEPEFLSELLARFGSADLFAATSRIEMQGDRVETGRTRFFYKRGAFRQEQIDSVGAKPGEPALWAGGGSSAYDREKFMELGGFEDLYEPCYMEDVSLSYSAWKRGWRIEFAPDSVVHHAHRGTSSKVFGHREVERLNQRNRELFFWRSVTDLGMLVSHAFHMPWNAVKDARWTDLRLQFEAVIATIPRLPAALGARRESRPFQRTSDGSVLATFR